MNPVVEVRQPPDGQAVPLVLDSPHSGTGYPADFEPVVDQASLRDLEDPFVDQLLAGTPGRGATLVCARFARAYIDPNRSEHDIDLDMLSGPWPEAVTPSTKTELGVGLVFRRTLDGRSIYADRLTPASVQERIARYYRPYHQALAGALNQAHLQFGHVWHLNCHSMPGGTGARRTRPDFCIGDRHGTTADRRLVERIVAILRECGYQVALNNPYAGVELVRRYADPIERRHSVQIEINRSLYMNEQTHVRHQGFERTMRVLERLVDELADDLRAAHTPRTARAAS